MQACLAAKCHYTDTTGEQDWLITLDQEYGAKFAASRPAALAGLAQMYTTGEIAAQLCLETPGLDTLDIAVFWGGSPTIASTQTILVNAATGRGLLPGAEPVRRAGSPTPASTAWRFPASTRWRWRCRGAAPRTRSGSARIRAWPTSRCWAACSTSALMLGVPQIVAAALKATEGMNDDDRYAALVADRGQRDEHHAAAREPAPQQVGGFGARLRARWGARTA